MTCKGICESLKVKKEPFKSEPELGVTIKYCTTCDGYFPIDNGLRCKCCHYLFRVHSVRSELRKKRPDYINKRY